MSEARKQPLRIEDVLREKGLYVSTTAGVSMYPMLRDRRDTIMIRPAEGRLKKYDVPLYRRGKAYVLHRIVKVLPDSYVIFITKDDAPGKGVIRHFAFATDDVDACVEAVKAAGYEVFIEPKDIEIASTPVFPARIAFCKGPLGEEIELFEEK